MELIKYTPETGVKNVPNIKALKEPIPIRVHYKKVGPDLVATEIVAKPEMKVPEKQLITTEDLTRLIAAGPEKSDYTLVDSRPGIKYAEGHIPTAISVPFPRMKQSIDELPKDKNRLLIFYCEGLR
jgi:3-mercaptopyruvate sulfurtransferase SseA